jgi:1,4-alpha-glucan branching enzyme
VGNLGVIEAVEGEQDGQPAHATLVLPPLATVWFRKSERSSGEPASRSS